MTRFIPFILFLVGLAVRLNSQTYYVKYDSNCFDRYEFTSGEEKQPYIVYTFKTNDGKVVQMDVGKEPVKWVKNLPSSLVECSTLSFDKAMVHAVNNSNTKLFVVRESPTHFNIAPVEKATHISSNANGMEVTMSDANFIMEWDKMYSDLNMATPASASEVYLIGTVINECLTGYIFKKDDGLKTNKFKEYVVIPEMGIVKKRSVIEGGNESYVLILDKIGDLSKLQYITKKCEVNTGYRAPNPILSSYADPVPSDPIDIAEIELLASGGIGNVPTAYSNNSPCGSPTKPGTHFVQKGETLYSISKKYGITVAQLKTWNGIGANNLINICQELIVKQMTTPAVSNPAPPATNTTTINVPPTAEGQKQFHIVKPNESVAQLAAMYGYTEERFRKMNSLGVYERVYAGQKLFTSDCDCPNTVGVSSGTPMPYDAVTSEPRLTTRGNPDVYFRPIKVHSVKENETLFAIALLYDTTIDRISELNGLDKNAKLTKGQKLYVQ